MNICFKIIILIGVLLFSSIVHAENNSLMNDFAEGNTAYDVKQYAVAIDYYQKALAQGPTAAIYFNLGNAYAQNKEIGWAVLNYKRALIYAPRDIDIRANLLFLQEQASIVVYPAILGESVIDYFTYANWLYLAIVLFWVTAFLVVWRFYYLVKKHWMTCGIVFVFLGCCFAVYGAIVSARLEARAIVVSQSMLKLAPTSKGEDLSKLIPGQEVEVLSVYQDYVQVRLANRAEGWVSKNTIEQILPTR